MIDENSELKSLVNNYLKTIETQKNKISSFENFENDKQVLLSEIKLIQDRLDKQRQIIRSRDV